MHDYLYFVCVQVTSIKSDLSGLGDGVEEFRAVCRQLQSLMRRIPDCAALHLRVRLTPSWTAGLMYVPSVMP